MSFIAEIVGGMSQTDLSALRRRTEKRSSLRGSVPNIYRVKSGAWQCEWDDLTEIGAFRSRFLGRAVRKAQRARQRYVLSCIAIEEERRRGIDFDTMEAT